MSVNISDPREDRPMIDGLPTLSKGAHKPGDGKACVMEYVALLAGEKWTDSPSCTHPVLARMAQAVNDRLPDSRRHELVPLIGRLFGTAEYGTDHERKVLSVRLAVWCARQSLPLVRERDRAACEAAVDAAEGWCDGRVTSAAADAAADADADAFAHAAYAAAYAAARDAYAAARAAAWTAWTAAHANNDVLALLTGLLDEYDRLTGRTEHRRVTDTDLRDLAAQVTARA